MKPLVLKMNDFGTFAGENVIDFRLLDNSDIFLITGDTGAGKSTIFDAIVFALFGEASGNRRQPDDFISHFKEKAETKVEFEFSHQGKVYKVIRTLKAQKEKASLKTAVLMGDNGEKIAENKKVVTEKIESLIEINKDQFGQIVVLAQGEFMKFIMSKPEEKSAILRNVFGTQRFEQLKKRLGDMNKQAKEKCNEVDLCIRTYLNNIDVEEAEIDKSNLDKIEETISYLSNMEKRQKEEYDLLYKNNEILKEKRETILKLCSKADNLTESLEHIKDIENEIEDIKIKQFETLSIKNNADSKLEKIKSNEENIKKILGEIATEKLMLNKYDTAEEIRKEICKLDDIYKKNEEDILKIQNEREKLAEKSIEYKNSIKETDDKSIEVKILEKKAFVEKSQLEIQNAVDICKKINKLLIMSEDVLKSEKELTEANKEYIKKDNEYSEKRNSFFANQAAILAEEIKGKNVPCPVCGATEFIKLAEYSGDVVTKEQLDKAEKSRNKADEKAKECLTVFTEKKSGYETFLENIKNEFIVYKKEFEPIKAKEFLKKYCIEKENNIKHINEEINCLNEIIENNKYYNEQIEKIAKKLDEIINNAENLKNDNEMTKIAIGEKSGALNTLLSNFRFESKKECENKIAELEKICENYEKDKNDANMVVEKSTKALTALNTRLEENIKFKKEEEKKAIEIKKYLEEEVNKSLKSRDISKDFIESCKNDITKEIEKITEQMQKIDAVKKNNAKVLANIKTSVKEREKVYSYATRIRSLYETSAGNVNKSGRVDFEQHILSYYFTKVINCADKRLKIMTDGRYMLMQKKDKKNDDISTLQLDIYDEYTGRARDVSSISGGEMFKCALAMALGLADVIKESAGGIELDAIFIDEGFGSLDSESRQQALKAIKAISNNKTVGIISHISELKDEIRSKITVIKGINGSSIKIQP